MFQWLIIHTVTTAALAGVVLTAGRWFRLGPAARHLLWLVVLVKFLTPPVVYWPWALPTLKPAAAPAAPIHHAIRTVIIDMPPDAEHAGPDLAEALPSAPVAAPPIEAAPAAPPFTWDWLPAAAVWTWLAGGVLVALMQATRVLCWHRRLRRGASAPDGLEALVRDLAGAMGIRPPRVIVLRGVASPMVWCFGVPRLLWPSGLEDRLSAPGCRAVLLHELAHLRRRDHWVGWLVLAGGCVWWWHPLYWWMRRRLSQEAELACDAYVVGAAPGARRAYAEALLEVSQRTAAAVAVPALGAMGGRRDLERRLVMIMRGPASRRLTGVGLAAAISLGLLALPAWTLGEDKTPPQLAPTAPTTTVTEAPPAATVTTAPEGSYYLPVTQYRKVTTSVPVTSYQLVSPGGTPAAPPTQAAAPDRDQKLKELEDKVQQLLKEMQQLRGQAPTGTMPSPGGVKQTTPQTSLLEYLTASPPIRVAPTPASPPPVALNERNFDVITLTRVTYKLKAATAEALATFLKENVKTAVLEIKSEGDSLTVTTTPEAQHVIGQLINLIQGKKPDVTLLYGPSGMAPLPVPQGATPGLDSPPPWPKYIGPPVAK